MYRFKFVAPNGVPGFSRFLMVSEPTDNNFASLAHELNRSKKQPTKDLIISVLDLPQANTSFLTPR